MVYHQRLEEMENRLRGVMAGMGTCSALRVATPVSNLATSGPVSSASDHFLSVRSRKSVASYQTEANLKVAPFISMTCSLCRASQIEDTMTSRLSVLSNES
jgi:hypothetical protein